MHLLSWARFLNLSNNEIPSAEATGDASLRGAPGEVHGQVCSKLMPSAGYEELLKCKNPISEQDNEFRTKPLQRKNCAV